MRRHYAQTVTLVDGSSVWSHSGFDPTPPAQTRIQAPNQTNEPERLETSPEPILDPAAPIMPSEGGSL
jgi:hypothetical protein